MKKIFSLLLLLSILKGFALAGYKDCGKDPEPRQEFSLVAGIKTSVLQHPWAMLITKYGNSLVHCSGSLVTPKFGLSAGHCFTGNSPDYVPIDELSLFFGVGDIKQLTGKIPFRAFKIQKRAIKKILTHPGYQYPRAYKDVSIIEFDMPVELTSTIYPVCLPEISLDPEHLAGEPAIVIGYGPHNDGTSLNKANQRVYHEELCSDRYSIEDASTDNAKLIKAELPNGFEGTIICSGNRRASEGTCRGDSGGPLLIDEYMDGEFTTVQNGVLHGSLQRCSNQKYPAIFSRLSHPDIHNWLFSNLFTVSENSSSLDYSYPDYSYPDYSSLNQNTSIGCLIPNKKYEGSANQTISGNACLPWSTPGLPRLFADQDKWNHNYCRNSGGFDDIPICYVDKSTYDDCEIPSCDLPL